MGKKQRQPKSFRLSATPGIDNLDGGAQSNSAKQYIYSWSSYADLQARSDSPSLSEFFNGVDTVAFKPGKKNILDLPGDWGIKKKGKTVPDTITGIPVVATNADTEEGIPEMFQVLLDFWSTGSPETFQTVIGRDASGVDVMYLAGIDNSGSAWGLTITGSPLDPFYAV
jgi:hypothetical protein